ncbi:MAG: hypothetical protein J0M12_10430 [Deltaproteobacteria bacterium]|nr:hypothetical protein [Deltaproteobacteria bacterium]
MSNSNSESPVLRLVARAEERRAQDAQTAPSVEVEDGLAAATAPSTFTNALESARQTWGSAGFNPAERDADIGKQVLETFVMGEMATSAIEYIMTSPAARNDMLPKSVWAMPAFDVLRDASISHTIAGIDAANATRTTALEYPPSVTNAKIAA